MSDELRVQCTVIKAKASKTIQEKPSCYVTAFVTGNQVIATNSVEKSRNPKWNKSYQFKLNDSQNLTIYLHNHIEGQPSQLLGSAVLTIREIKHYLDRRLFTTMKRVTLSMNLHGDRFQAHPNYKLIIGLNKWRQSTSTSSNVQGQPVGAATTAAESQTTTATSLQDRPASTSNIQTVSGTETSDAGNTQSARTQTEQGEANSASSIGRQAQSLSPNLDGVVVQTEDNVSTQADIAAWAQRRSVNRQNFDERFLFSADQPATPIPDVIDSRNLPVIINNLLGPLPDYIEERFDTNMERKFYANHQEKKCSWIDPRLFWIDPELFPLPKHWKMTFTKLGLPYFIDNARKSTTFTDPRTGVPIFPPPCIAMKFKVSFKEKTSYFRTLCKEYLKEGITRIPISRKRLLEESFGSIMAFPPTKLHRHLCVKFENEAGLDYGGLSREWLYEISHEIINPMYGLFMTRGSSSDYVFDINPLSSMAQNNFEYFTFIGRIIGLALFHSKFLDCAFSTVFYKQILNRPCVLEDLQQVDIDFYNSVKWIAKNNIEEAQMELFFCSEVESFGQLTLVELKPGGNDLQVTEKNKFEYIKLLVDWKLNYGKREQLRRIILGISHIVPITWVRAFTVKEFEMMLCGMQNYDVDDWKANVRFKGGYSDKSIQVIWFWEFVESLDPEFRGKLLHFITGTTRVPPTGFKDLIGSNGPQKFCIEKWGGPQDLPRSHTCFNRLDLPPYSNYNDLKSKMLTAIEEGQGFHQE